MSGRAGLSDPVAQYRDGSRLEARIALHARFSTNPLDWYQFVMDRMRARLSDDARVLEVGAGTGGLWRRAAACTPPRWHLLLTDRSPGILADGRRALAGQVPSAHWAVCDAARPPLRRHAVDAVIANHMLYHVADRPRALAALARVLRRDGVLFAATVGSGHMAALEARLASAGVPPERLGGTAVAGFTLENGSMQLAACFERVERHDHRDALIVDEVEPLLAYADSLGGWPPAVLERLRTDLSRELDARGAIRIEKQVGVFVAEGPRPSAAA